MDTPDRTAALQRLDALAGEWTTESGHPFEPDTRVTGRVSFEWLDGGFFLIGHSTVDHPDFPSALQVIGCDEAGERCSMHFFDSRGVSRVYEMSLHDGVWTMWRDDPDFAQRYKGTFSEDRSTIEGAWERSIDGPALQHDFDLSYTKVA